MPQNIVVGDEAEAVAEFVAEYAGSEVDRPPQPGDASEIESEEQQAGGRGRASAPAAAVLDLRAIREDPEPARAALARRGAAEALDELLDARRPPPRAAARGRGPPRGPERGLGRDRRREARGRGRRAR